MLFENEFEASVQEDWHTFRSLVPFGLDTDSEPILDEVYNWLQRFLNAHPSEVDRKNIIHKLSTMMQSVRTASELVDAVMPDFKIERRSDGTIDVSWKKADDVN